MLARLKAILSNLLSAISPHSKSWVGAAISVFFLTALIVLASATGLFHNLVPVEDIALYSIFVIGITALTAGGTLFLITLFQLLPLLYRYALVCFILIIYYFFIPPIEVWGLSLISSWILLSASLTGGALICLIAASSSKTYSNNRVKVLSCLAAGTLSLTLAGFWLFGHFSTFTPPTLDRTSNAPDQISLPNPSLPGTFSVKELSYGSGKDSHRPEYGVNVSLVTEPVDGSPFINEWEGFEGWQRSHYFGFDQTSLPLNGKVWFPEGDGPFPLVMIVHGNHEMTASSDLGYGYLGTLLASRGFITVSIDENFLNSSWLSDLNAAPARGWLLLEHLKLWRSWNALAANPFYQKIDMDRIALIGHSRGGEAIAAAASLNPLRVYPGNGNIALDFGFNIRALAAIAPIDAQFTPGGKKIELSNIDYLAIHGSQDGDVRSFEGSAQFRRIHFTDANYHFKAALYILGANHGQFNTKWGSDDITPPVSVFLNSQEQLPMEQQLQIAKVYVPAFLEATLKDQTGYLPLFQNYLSGETWLPKTLYLNEFVDSNFQYVIRNDPSTIDITKTALTGGEQRGENLDVWRQRRVPLKDGELMQVGIYLGWDTASSPLPPSYIIDLPEHGLKLTPKNILVLDLANGNRKDDPSSNGKNQPVDFTIELTDAQGNKATTFLSHDALLPPAYNANIMKATFLDSDRPRDYVFKTFELPLSAFTDQNPSLNPSTLKTIRFLFDKTPEGLIVLDSVAFKNP